MGYYSYMDSNNLEILNPEAVKGVISESSGIEDLHYFKVEKHTSADGKESYSLEPEDGDFYGKWYYQEDLVRDIAPYVKGEIIYTGEDGEKWGYLIKDRKVYPINFEVKKIIGNKELE